MDWSIAAGFIAGGLLLGAWLHAKDRRRVLALWRQQQRTRPGAVVHAPGAGMLPQLHVPLKGGMLRVTVMGKGLDSPETGQMTCLDFDDPSPAVISLVVRECRNALSEALDRAIPIGVDAVPLGDATFDQRFRLQSSDPQRAISLLRRRNLFRLLMALPRGAHLQLGLGRCAICVNGLPRSDADVNALIEAALVVVHALADPDG